MSLTMMPRAELMILFLDMIGLTESTVQQIAVKCLTDYSGSAVATQPEVSILLTATMSEVDAVRDAALRGLQVQALVLALVWGGV
jgi:hypothetical protein